MTLKGLTTAPTEAQKTTLASKEAEVQAVLNCLQERITVTSTASNQVSTAQESILNLKRQIDEEKKSVELARDRVKYIRRPEEHTSYYESWFPLNRPLKQGSLVLLMSLALVISLVILFIGLSFLGFSPTVAIDAKGYSILSYIYSQFTLGFWLILIGSIVGLWYLVYRTNA